jgi:hypothetical protein
MGAVGLAMPETSSGQESGRTVSPVMSYASMTYKNTGAQKMNEE